MKQNLRSSILCVLLSTLCISSYADNTSANIGYFRDTFVDDSIRPVTIIGSEPSYTVIKPYCFSNDNMDVSLSYDAPQEGDESQYSNGGFYAYFYPMLFSNKDEKVMHLKDFYNESDFSRYSRYLEEENLQKLYQGVTQYQKNGDPGVIQMVSCCNNKAYDYIGGHMSCCGVISIYLPGQVTVYETGDKDENSNKVYIHNYLTSGVDHARLYVTYDDYKAAAFFSNPQNSIELDTTCTITYECKKSGKYLMKIVGYDSKGEELSSAIDTFLYVAAVNENDTWVARYTGKWYPDDYPYLDHKNMPIETKENLILYQSKENPYTFKIGKVWGDKDFYFTMKTSNNLGESSNLKWNSQKPDFTIDGDSIAFHSIDGYFYCDGCLMEGFYNQTKYTSNSSTFCFPLFYNSISSTSTSTSFCNFAYFTLEHAIYDTDIEKVSAVQSVQSVKYYNINGQQTGGLHHGLNIVKSADGTSKIVMKK